MFDESRTNESNTSLNEREITAQKSQTVTMNNQLFQEDLISNLLNYFYLPINIMYLRIFFMPFMTIFYSFNNSIALKYIYIYIYIYKQLIINY